MFEFEVNGKTFKAEVTFYTGYLYEAEFQGDLVSDLFGVQDVEPLMEVERTGDGEDDYRIVKLDFSKVNWNTVSKVLWAAVKTADKRAPGYIDWLKATSGVNLWLVQDELSEAVSDCFFRPETPKEEVEGQEG